MFKSLGMKPLIIILIAFVGLYIVAEILSATDRNFRSELTEFDNEQVDQIRIIHPNADYAIELIKSGNEWKVVAGSHNYLADGNTIKNILGSISNLKTERVAATKKEKWGNFDVTDSTAVFIKVEANGEIVCKLLVGKMDFKQIPSKNQYQQQPQIKTTSFVRIPGDDAVYAVDAYLKPIFSNDINRYRNKNLVVGFDKDDISRLFYGGDNGFHVQANNGQWLVDGQMADSTATMNQVNKLINLMGQNFVNDVNISGQASHTLKIEGNNTSPIEINAYPADSTHKYYITSSVNPGSIFSGDKLFEKIFFEKKSFFKHE